MLEQDPTLRHLVREKRSWPWYHDDVRTAILLELYGQTRPQKQQSVQNRRKEAKYIVRALGELATKATALVANLRTSDISIDTDDGLFTVGLTPLLKTCETLVAQSQYVIGLVRRPYTHEPDVVSQCLGHSGNAM